MTRHHRRARAALPACLAILVVVGAGCRGQGELPPETPPDAVPAGTVLGTGAVAGRVTFTGTPPEPEPISMQSDANCQHAHAEPVLRETLVVGRDGGLRDVFVRIAEGMDRRFAPPPDNVSLDQVGCRYQPHVVGVQVGQPLRITNSDPTLHNVHSVSTANPAFNFGMTVQGQQATRYFASEEVMVKVKCDVHPWMAAWIGVVWHPYFDVTDEEGRFSLEGLPDGTYTLEAWHESLGTSRREVTIREGATAPVDFTFGTEP